MRSPHRQKGPRKRLLMLVRSIVAIVLGTVGFGGCRTSMPVGGDSSVPDVPTIVDASRVDVSRPDSGRTDVVIPSRDGAVPLVEFVGADQVRLHPWESTFRSRPQCMGRPSAGPRMYGNFAGYSCQSGEWYYTQNGGAVERLSLRQNITQILVAGDNSPSANGTSANMACLRDGFVLRLTTFRPLVPPTFPGETEPDHSMIAIFDNDIARPGRIIWNERANVQLPGSMIAASDRLIAWDIYRRPGEHIALLATDQNGENLVEIARAAHGSELDELMADGPNLIWNVDGADIFHWHADTRVTENLSNDRGGQWSAFISGNYITWLDQSHMLMGGIGRPDNPEVHLYNLQTRERLRITNDPADRPVGQSYPSIVGDWVLWADFRNAQSPNQRFRFTDRMELYGYHIPTGVTQPVLEGFIQVGLSRGFGDGMIRVNCIDAGSGAIASALALPMPVPIVRDR